MFENFITLIFNIMKTLMKHKKEFIISLITAVVVFYAQPILNFLGDFFVNILLMVSKSFSNYYYTSIAMNDTNAFASWNNYLLILIIFVIVGRFIADGRLLQNKNRKNIEHTLKTIEENISELILEKPKENKNRDDLLKDLNNLKNETIQTQKYILKTDKIFRPFCIFIICIVLFFFAHYAVQKSVSSANVGFRNNLIKIAPYIMDSERKMFESKWALMKNRADYDEIQKSIINILQAKKNEKTQ
jgi:ABC-type multidrug transport system fused ATPase/permease subunit